MSEALVKHEAGITYRQATDVAGMCKQIVVSTAIEIQKRKYVKVEGWQAIAVAHGCVASARDVERVCGGVRAIGEVRRGSDGMVLSTAEGFVGDDEATWGSRAEYAKRAMAQTRAISRACRSAFAHVVVMMNAGLETTPAEEVPEGGLTDKPDKKQDNKPAQEQVTIEADVKTTVTTIGELNFKSGMKNGKAWKRFYVKGDDGEYYSTFDSNLAEKIEELSGELVTINYRLVETAKGVSRDVVDIIKDDLPDNGDPDRKRKDGNPL
jgi:hypothetical protein